MGVAAPIEEDQRRELLLELARVLDRPYEEAEPRGAFLPLHQHQRLLTERPLLVVGERGAGKSALFRFLKSLGSDVRSVFPGLPQQLHWLAGFEDDLTQPATDAVWSWARGKPRPDLEHFWLGHLVGWLVRTGFLTEEVPWFASWDSAPHDPAAWVPAVSASLPAIHRCLDATERQLREQKTVLVIGYDDLDRFEVGDRLAVARELVVALVGVWQSLGSRQRNLQARVLLRPDLADHVRTTSSDASKLRDRTLELRWSAEDVFRVLLYRLAGSHPLRTWLGDTIPLTSSPVLGWVPPAALPEHTQLDLFLPSRRVPTQEDFGALLVGPAMGDGPKKGRVHTWLLNHTRDGKGQHLPRVLLNLLRNAAHAALESSHRASDDHLLLPEDLDAALRPTGAQRLDELAEVYPEAIDQVRRLAQKRVPMEVVETETAVESANLKLLESIGVMTRRADGRVDTPELFRSALQLKRKGGSRRRD